MQGFSQAALVMGRYNPTGCFVIDHTSRIGIFRDNYWPPRSKRFDTNIGQPLSRRIKNRYIARMVIVFRIACLRMLNDNGIQSVPIDRFIQHYFCLRMVDRPNHKEADIIWELTLLLQYSQPLNSPMDIFLEEDTPQGHENAANSRGMMLTPVTIMRLSIVLKGDSIGNIDHLVSWHPRLGFQHLF